MSEKYFKLLNDKNAKGIVNETFATEGELRQLANFFLTGSKYDRKNLDYLKEDLKEVIEFVNRFYEVTEIDEEEYKKKTEKPKAKLFSIAVFVSEWDEKESEEGIEQRMYEYIEEYAPSYTVRDVARELEQAKFITYPHVGGTGVTLINMKHVTEISIMEETVEEA